MFYNTTFAPAFERERRYKMMNQTFRKKSSGIIWKFKIKVLIFAATFAKRKRQKSSLIDLHNSTSSTSIGEEILRINTVNRSMTLDYDKRIPERGYDKTYCGKMVNVSANGFAFAAASDDFAELKGTQLVLDIPDFPVKEERTMEGVVIRSTDNHGEIVGLLGPNGAGKTTSFYMTVGLITPNEVFCINRG